MASFFKQNDFLRLCDPKATWPLSDPSAYWSGNCHLSDKQYIAKKAVEASFENTYRQRVDRPHWAAFKAEMQENKSPSHTSSIC